MSGVFLWMYSLSHVGSCSGSLFTRIRKYDFKLQRHVIEKNYHKKRSVSEASLYYLYYIAQRSLFARNNETVS